MAVNWNDSGLKWRYEYVLRRAKDAGFTEEELEEANLRKLNHQTKSIRIRRMISLAFYLGQLRGILDANEGKNKITLDPLEFIRKETE